MEQEIKKLIISIIKDNIDIYMNNDKYFKEFKKFLKENYDNDLIIIASYDLKIKFIKEIISDLLIVPVLYDFYE